MSEDMIRALGAATAPVIDHARAEDFETYTAMARSATWAGAAAAFLTAPSIRSGAIRSGLAVAAGSVGTAALTVEARKARGDAPRREPTAPAMPTDQRAPGPVGQGAERGDAWWVAARFATAAGGYAAYQLFRSAPTTRAGMIRAGAGLAAGGAASTVLDAVGKVQAGRGESGLAAPDIGAASRSGSATPPAGSSRSAGAGVAPWGWLGGGSAHAATPGRGFIDGDAARRSERAPARPAPRPRPTAERRGPADRIAYERADGETVMRTRAQIRADRRRRKR